MKNVHLALCQGHWTGDFETTKELYSNLIREATTRGATLICLPEFTLSPYFASSRDRSGMRFAEALTEGPSANFFSEEAKKLKVTIVGSIFEKDAEKYWNTAVTWGPDGNLKGFTRKVHIPCSVGYYESDFFDGAEDFPVHDLGVVKLATPTCYDQWYPELARIYALNGAELIFYPTAIGGELVGSNEDFDSSGAWQTVMRGHAVANGLFVAAANRVGTESVPFYGSSFICDPQGNVLASASRDKDEVIDVVLDHKLRERYLYLFPLLHGRKPHLYKRILDKYEGPGKPDWLQKAQEEKTL